MTLYTAGRSWLAMAKHWLNDKQDPSHRRAARLAREHMHVPKGLPNNRTQRGSVWAIGIMKNEADVVELSVLHQLRQGADRVLIADNGSIDGTLELLHDLARTYPVYVATDSWPAWDQAVKTTLLAQTARRAGADWIVPFDADEFWFASDVLVADYLRNLKATIAYAQIHNLFPLSDEMLMPDTQFRFDTTAPRLRKAAFRSHRMASVSAGNHHAYRWGARDDGLRIAHLPWRSLDQMRRKASQGSAATVAAELQASVSGHWRVIADLSDDVLAQVWRCILAGERVPDIGWSPVGPFLRLSPLAWPTWDPDGVLSARST